MGGVLLVDEVVCEYVHSSKIGYKSVVGWSEWRSEMPFFFSEPTLVKNLSLIRFLTVQPSEVLALQD